MIDGEGILVASGERDRAGTRIVRSAIGDGALSRSSISIVLAPIRKRLCGVPRSRACIGVLLELACGLLGVAPVASLLLLHGRMGYGRRIP